MSESLRNAIHEDNIRLQKAILWEEAKGKLRALVAASGQMRGNGISPSWSLVAAAVDEFIETFENRGLEE